MFLLGVMSAAVVLAGGVAFAATISCKVGVVCNGTRASDVISGTARNDTMRGLAGNDTMRASAGDDWLDGGTGRDALNGGVDNDRYIFGPVWGTDTIADASGNDTVNFSTFTTGPSASGRLTIDLIGHPDTPEIATDCPPCFRVDFPATVLIENAIGGPEQDEIEGNNLRNRLVGNGGTDVISGRGGADALLGGADGDELYGGTGNDALNGGDGDDQYVFEEDWGRDTITADASGQDQIHFGIVVFPPGSRGVVVDLAGGADAEVSSPVGTVDLASAATIEDVVGSFYPDLIRGNGAANKIDGEGGDDELSGGGGDDTLDGWSGNDTIDGGPGDDTIQARDGEADTIDCGDGANDRALFDAGVDSVVGCEL